MCDIYLSNVYTYMGLESKLYFIRNTTLRNMPTEISVYIVISSMGGQMDSYQCICENAKVKNYGKKKTAK